VNILILLDGAHIARQLAFAPADIETAMPLLSIWFQREFIEHLDPVGRARLADVLARSDAA
jgi:hypothetical protein